MNKPTTHLEVGEDALELVEYLSILVADPLVLHLTAQEASAELRDHKDLLQNRVHVARCAQVQQPDKATRGLSQRLGAVVPRLGHL